MKFKLGFLALLAVSAPGALAANFGPCQFILSPYPGATANYRPFELDEKGALQIDMKNPNILSFKEKKNVTTIKYSWIGLDKNHHSKIYKNTVYIVRNADGKPTNIEEVLDPSAEKNADKWNKKEAKVEGQEYNKPGIEFGANGYALDYDKNGTCFLKRMTSVDRDMQNAYVTYDHDLCKEMVGAQSGHSAGFAAPQEMEIEAKYIKQFKKDNLHLGAYLAGKEVEVKKGGDPFSAMSLTGVCSMFMPMIPAQGMGMGGMIGGIGMAPMPGPDENGVTAGSAEQAKPKD